ncbi:MAG: UDP-3-O-(3-hydroxymyristoyl)glucosamine N-acyltransferase [Candidatus Scalindua sp. AMX11]|nr:MAG: UDP-3-O-(3-hydroxymyristoyl)glucosamine N-acyltransferase [Candidatus Scalindua sp.]NOG83292.1 UDP-3-O-(3-hydroxymyristoyl)glucosamine N-acyltransferase [Planctomycetota bacterium]RZV71946.1 MAG: UDP-3-O-(3-hydroxymyristoyl)glucosamine N-acyltransferase [Candidatus Scalindua sp. SCAELEC01]TDE63616.1 MAG: UDP-3-O-(3-hydroxymyristoyl)glucosamine N-acyltransferase [Candidatus Scalindua sp. AMX11]GJQ60063.1 MAG: UDP-3-O-acylglucosamine N-acyltransferase [Candidatus Scalindua sp.]
MKFNLQQINEIIDGKLFGDGNIVITGVSSIGQSKEGDISFIKDESLINEIYKTKASAVVVHRPIKDTKKPLIITKNPFLAFTKFLQVVSDQNRSQLCLVHDSAIIGKRSCLGQDVSLGANVVIDEETTIGNNVTIYPNVYIGKNCTIGDHSTIYPNVTIREEVVIGKRVIVHSGTTIGGDGFGYLQIKRKHVKIPQVGSVEIGDDVEIGSNVTIDRATLDKTVIGPGVKIDNHSHIAHNVVIGENTMLIAYAKIAGGARIGKNVMIAEDVGITDHAVIGDNCIIGGGSNVYKSLEPGSVVWGSPAKPLNLEKRIQVIIKKLPEIYKKIKGTR